MKSWGKPSGGWDGDPEGGGRHEREDFWACESTAASSPVAGVSGLDKPSNPHGLCGLETETGDRALGDGGARGEGGIVSVHVQYSTSVQPTSLPSTYMPGKPGGERC